MPANPASLRGKRFLARGALQLMSSWRKAPQTNPEIQFVSLVAPQFVQ